MSSVHNKPNPAALWMRKARQSCWSSRAQELLNLLRSLRYSHGMTINNVDARLSHVDSDEPEGCRMEKQRVALFGTVSCKRGVIPRLSVRPGTAPLFARSKCARMTNPAETLPLRTDRTIGKRQQTPIFLLRLLVELEDRTGKNATNSRTDSGAIRPPCRVFVSMTNRSCTGPSNKSGVGFS